MTQTADNVSSVTKNLHSRHSNLPWRITRNTLRYFLVALPEFVLGASSPKLLDLMVRFLSLAARCLALAINTFSILISVSRPGTSQPYLLLHNYLFSREKAFGFVYCMQGYYDARYKSFAEFMCNYSIALLFSFTLSSLFRLNHAPPTLQLDLTKTMNK